MPPPCVVATLLIMWLFVAWMYAGTGPPPTFLSTYSHRFAFMTCACPHNMLQVLGPDLHMGSLIIMCPLMSVLAAYVVVKFGL